MRVSLGADFDLEDYEKWLKFNGAEIFSPLGHGRSPFGISYRVRQDTKKKTLMRNTASGPLVGSGPIWLDLECYLSGVGLPHRILPIENFDLPEGEHQICIDASVRKYKKSQRSAWGACLLRQGKQPVIVGGGFQSHSFRHSGDAELAGVGNGIATLVKNGVIRAGDRIRVFNDNEPVVRLLQGKHKQPPGKKDKRWRYDAAKKIEALLKKHQIKACFEWVKGHQKVDVECYAARANRLADARAAKEVQKQKSSKRNEAVHG